MSSSRSENRDSSTAQPKKPPSSSAAAKPPQDQQTLKCPRCNSPNTKFCYYNNYSLSQPRHFCKTCRRYWTRGGALRNVPIGGGCRKTRKAAVKPASNSSLSSCSTTSSSSSSSSRFFMEDSKFFHGGLVSPTMDFQLAGLSLNKIVNLNPNFSAGGGPLFNENNNNNLPLCSSSSFGDQTTTVDGGSGLSLMGFGDYPVTNPGFSSGAGPGSVAGGVDGNLASSIETLSSLNQDLHWKLQQQRMAMLFGSKETTTRNGSDHGGVPNSPVERPQPILFRNLEMEYSTRKEDDSGETSTTEWYFGNSAYAPNNNNHNPVGAATTNDDWHGVHQAANWTDLNQFNALP